MGFALVFPGQGSQSVGMMKGLTDSDAVRRTFAEASDVLHQDLWRLSEAGPADAQSLTVNTQPLMLTAGIAVFRAWKAAGGPDPVAMAGHSLGEYSALVAAGSLAFADALPLVRLRAEAMQQAVPVGTGAMAAVLGLDDDSVRSACKEAEQGEIVEAVNFNAPSQVVIAGHKAAVERAAAACKARGAKRAMLLPVSAPFHSSLLRPAAERLAEALRTIALRMPSIPVINNVDVATPVQEDALRDSLARQACNPVRWVEVVQAIGQRGGEVLVECGPGKVLAGLAKRIDARLQGLSVASNADLEAALLAVR